MQVNDTSRGSSLETRWSAFQGLQVLFTRTIMTFRKSSND